MAGEAAARPWWSKPERLHLGLCACAALIVIFFGDPLETQELQWFGQCLRWRFAARLAPPVERSIVHLNIDAQDIKNLPTLESEYAAAARIVHEASALGASVVAFDIIFARANRETAQPLLDAIEAHKNVVLAEALNARPGETQPSVPIRSFPFLDSAPAPGGLINLSADGDGVIRHYNLVQRSKEGYQPSLAFAAYLTSLGLDWKRDVSISAADHVEWKELSSADYATMIPHRAPVRPVLLDLRCPWAVESGSAAFQYLNLRQLDALFAKTGAAGNAKPLSNKIVFVGYVAIGQGDLGSTVFGPHEPLIYLHSTALNDLTQRSWLRRTSRAEDAGLIGLVLLSTFIIRKRRGAVSLWAFWLLGITAIGTASIGAIWKANLVFGSVMIALMWSILIVAELGRRYGAELFEKLMLRATMGFYFSPRVLERVLQNPGSMEPQEAELTVLLTDLRNSTPIAELLGARGTFDFLNKIFEAETRAVMAEDGTLEHFLGDQFLAYWGAPDPQPDAADRACRAALALIEAMEQLRETLTQDVRSLFGYGVTLHKGSALIGNKGSQQRLDYGVVGDLINAAARVESLTKYYGVLFLVTREAYSALSAAPVARLLDCVVVKGKTSPLELIEMRHQFSADNFEQIATKYRAAFTFYEDGDFARAGRFFTEIARQHNDPPSRVMATRCVELSADRPEDWRGIYALQAK